MHCCSLLRGAAVGAVQRVEALPEGQLVDGGVKNLWRERVTPPAIPGVQRRPPRAPAIVDRGVHAVCVGHRGVGQGWPVRAGA